MFMLHRWIFIKKFYDCVLIAFAYLFSILCLLCPLQASNSGCFTFKKLTTFKNFSIEANNIDKNTLVIFDVDDVLILQNDLILRSNPETMKHFEFLFDKFSQESGSISSEQWDCLKSKIYLFGQRRVIEPEVVQLIKDMQMQGIKVIALTACSGGQCGSIESLADWRIQDLENHGMTFQHAFPEIGTVFFHPSSDMKDEYPMFKSGCLFSAGYPKGLVLELFLQHHVKKVYPEWQPKKIVFFDDQRSNLETVKTCATNLKIFYSGFHYRHPMTQQPLPQSRSDLDKVEEQIRCLVQYNVWLSDDHPDLTPTIH